MTQDNHTYQAMFLLDNQEVRQNGFNAVRERVKTTLEKHGLSAKVLRLWGERKLAYAIGQRRRATYLLGWIEGSGESVNQAKADFYLVGPVFRCTFLREDAIPEEELAFGIEEIEDSAVVIPDDVEEIVEEPAADDADDDSSGDDSGDSDSDSDDDSDDEEDK
jgi:ribosomal protein S6